MKIVFVVKYYDQYRASFYARTPDLAGLSYDELVQRYVDDYFSFYSSLVNIFNAQGHEAHLLIPNCPQIRDKWCAKHKLTAKLTNKEFIESAVEAIRPDVVFLSSNFEYFGEFSKQLRKQVKALCCWISCPFENSLELDHFDAVFTLFPPHYDSFKKRGLNTHLVTAGFDPAILDKAAMNGPAIAFSFVGGIGGFHKTREKYLRRVCKKTPLKLWGYGYSSDNPVKRVLKDIRNGFAWNSHYQGKAWGLDMFSILGRSKITLNVHGDIAEGHSVNMRLFEATGMGTLLLTDHADNVTALFTPDVEIVTFKTPEEAIEKYNYYSTHEEERKKIAKAGQEKTLALYSYVGIAGIFMNEFKQLISR